MEDKGRQQEKKCLRIEEYNEEITENPFIPDQIEKISSSIEGEVVELENPEKNNIEERAKSKGKMTMNDEQYENYERSKMIQEEKKRFIEILSSGDKCISSPLELEIPIWQHPLVPSKEEEVVDFQSIGKDCIEEHVDPKGKAIMNDEQHEMHNMEFNYISHRNDSFRRKNRFQEEKKKFIEMLSFGDKCTSSPLELEIPNRQPLSDPSKVSDVFNIQPRPFDPEAYVEVEVDGNMAGAVDDDEANPKKPFYLPNNVVRWTEVENQDDIITRESNARFIKWSDGSLQLQIGDEAFDVTKEDIQNEENHLCLRYDEQEILEAQGKIQNKLIVMPSSLSSSSHNSLTVHIDSQQAKSPKVKSCPTEMDPEWVMMQEAKNV